MPMKRARAWSSYPGANPAGFKRTRTVVSGYRRRKYGVSKRVSRYRSSGPSVPWVAKAFPAEAKHHDLDFNDVTIDYSGAIQSLAAISVGTSDITRIGDSLRMLSISLNFVLTLGTTPNVVRLMVIRYYNKPTAPVVSDILALTGNTRAPFSPFSHDNVGNFEVLWDHMVMLDGYRPTKTVRKVITCNPNYRVQYNSGGTVPIKNFYGLLTISDDGAVAYPLVRGGMRMNYIDP